jgi:diadenosine tetraphosphatase ApaH/serine/threonine PP2A family protein phosphatase
MRLALLSDLHANSQALEACLAHAKNQDVAQYAFLGDLVGYGANPAEVLSRVMALAEAGALVLKGNHDSMAAHPPTDDQSVGANTTAWTHGQLTPAQLQFLKNLPMTLEMQDSLLVHASARDPERWIYVNSEESALSCLEAAFEQKQKSHVFVGHVHEQGLYYQGTGRGLLHFAPTPGAAVPVPSHRRWLATVGSVGQPRDGDTRAMYAIYDLAASKLVFHRVEYDFTAAANAIRAAGLPVRFAERLEVGR